MPEAANPQIESYSAKTNGPRVPKKENIDTNM